MPSLADTRKFPKSARVRTRADYACAFEGARRLHSPLLQLAVKRDPDTGGAAPADITAATGARLGIAVSRKVDRNAVGRNRIKRVWRETFRHQCALLPPGSYVAIAKPAAAQADNPALRAALLDLLARAARLPGSPATGTMPPDVPSTPSSHGALSAAPHSG